MEIKTDFRNIKDEQKVTEELPFDFPLPSNKMLTKAGEYLREQWGRDEPIEEKYIQIINNYRQYHNYVLDDFRFKLEDKLMRLNLSPTQGYRLKRLDSIANKLKRQKLKNKNMRLPQMEDIAGIRVIFNDMEELNKFLNDKADYEGFEHCEKKTNRDYIESSKSQDGYRSVHQIFKGKVTAKKEDGKIEEKWFRLELQIRTKLQHQWATTIEIYDDLMRSSHQDKTEKSSLKIGGGDDKARQFFKLCSHLMALDEKTPVLDEFKTVALKDIVQQIKQLDDELKILNLLNSLPIELDNKFKPTSNTAYFILFLKTVSTAKWKQMPYSKADEELAFKEYQKQEIEFKDDPNVNVVLVSVDQFSKLAAAYPNYQLDARDFCQYIKQKLANY